MPLRIYLAPIVVLSLVACCSSCADAGPVVLVGKNVPAEERVSMDQIDHRLWDQLLQKYVDQQGRVAYGPWAAHAGHLRALDAYLGNLSIADPNQPATPQAKLAFWINAYNAVTVKGILREYPTDSIRKHTSKFGGYNIWKDLQLIVGGSAISLDSIEHQVLRKMGEPRIHFAIVCASHSCPRLLNQAYVSDQIDSQLTENTRAFFGNPENFRYDASSGRFQMSAIIDWFGEDFGANDSARLQTLSPWLPSSESRQAAATGAGRISYLSYDWSLNDRPNLPSSATPPTVAQP